jgi:hypothetical protein
VHFDFSEAFGLIISRDQHTGWCARHGGHGVWDFKALYEYGTLGRIDGPLDGISAWIRHATNLAVEKIWVECDANL